VVFVELNPTKQPLKLHKLVKYTDAPDPVPNDTQKVDPAAATQEKVEGKRFKSRKILRVLDKKGSYTPMAIGSNI
jgi:hypothetical protein